MASLQEALGYEPLGSARRRERENKRSNFGRGFSAGIDQTMGLFGGLKAWAGETIGDDDMVTEGLDYYNQKMAEAAENQGDVMSYEDIDGLDSLADYSFYMIGNLIPTIGSVALSGGTLGAAAQVGGRAAANMAVKKKAKQLVDKKVKDQADKLANRELLKRYAGQTRGRVTQAGKRAGKAGQTVGGIGASIGMSTGDTFASIYQETGELDAGTALGAGILSGSLDALTGMRALKRILPVEKYKKAREQVGEKAVAKRKLHQRVLQESFKSAGIEGVTEATQELIQEVAIELVENDYSSLSDAMSEAIQQEGAKSLYINAALAGALGGGVIGGVSGIAADRGPQPTRPKREVPQRDPEAETIEPAPFEPQPEQEVEAAETPLTQDQQLERTIKAREEARRILSEAQQELDLGPPTLEAAPRVPDLVGQEVTYGDVRGVLTEREDGFFVVTPDEDVFIESGASIKSAESLGVAPTDQTVQFDDEVIYDQATSKISIRGKEYTYTRSNTNDEGKVISVTAVDSTGKEVTFRNDKVVDRVVRQLESSERQFNSEEMILVDELPFQVQRQLMTDQMSEGATSMPEQISSQQAMDIVDQVALFDGSDPEQLRLEVGEAQKRTATFLQNNQEAGKRSSEMGIEVDSGWKAIDRSNDQVDSNTAIERHNALAGMDLPVPGTNDTYVVDPIAPEVLSATESGIPFDRTFQGIRYQSNPVSGREEKEPVRLALMDIASSGFPQRIINAVKGFGIHEDGTGALNSVEGFYGHEAGFLSLGSEVATDPKRLRNVLTHELSHTLDDVDGVTLNDPNFSIELTEMESDVVGIDMGDVLFELYQAYLTSSPIGNYFNYPFATVMSDLSKAQEGFINGNMSIGDFMSAQAGQMRTVQKEAFAQGSALYFSDPALLAANAPKMYKFMRDLVSPEQDIQNESANREQTAQSESGSIPGEVRPPATGAPVQGQDIDSAGRDSGTGPIQGESSQGMGELVGQEPAELQLPLDLKEVSTLFPTGASREADPVESLIVSNYEGFENGGDQFTKVTNTISSYNNLTKNEQRRTPKARAEALIQHAVDNLLHIYDQVPQEIRDTSKLWYVGANKIANQFSEQYGITLSQASAAIANLSPQKDWYMNASLAERTIDVWANHRTESWNDEMEAKALALFVNKKDLSEKAKKVNPIILSNIRGKSLQDLIDEDASLAELGMWTRTWDQVNNNTKYRLVSPDGTLLDFVKTDKGQDARLAWGSNIEIGKAVSVLIDGSDAKISESLGEANKVRNFYNNIFAPMSDKGFVTIDTHAVAAALFKPLSGKSAEVAHNFGTGAANSKVTGYRGTYAIFEEAYRRAANERGVLPREMQSITWEAVRGLFTAKYKNKQNMLFAEGVWKQYSDGKITLDEARTKVNEHAGGFDRPDWAGSGRDQDVQEAGTPTFERGLSGTDVSRPELEGRPADRGRGVDAPADVQARRRVNEEPASPNEDLNRAVREERTFVDSAIDSVKTKFRRYMMPGGLLPESVFKLKIERDSQLGAVEIDIGQLVRAYDVAVENAGGNLTEAEQKLHNEAMGERFGEIDSLGLDPEVKDAIKMMRKYVDQMSAEYAQVVFNDARRLMEQGSKEQAAAKVDLLNTLANNIGSYVHRSYRAFDDPNWFKNVPDEVLDRARKYLQESGASNVENVINTILKDGTAYDSMEAMIRESNLGAKDLSILKQRKDIAPEIRDLLGEYKEPRINFGKTATKMSRLLFNDRFLKKVLADGEGVYLFNATDAPAEAFTTIAAEGSQVMAPLDGLKTTPEIAQAFKDALGKEEMADWYRMIVQANGLVKFGKTVLSPTTVARNYMSAYFFTLANGHFNMSKAEQAWESKQAFFNREGDKVAYMRRLKELGVIYDSPYTGEMMKLLEESKLEFTYQNKYQGNNVADFTKRMTDRATKFYQYGDDFWKIIGFENEIDILMDAKGLTREEAEPLAAERIRNTYPTYSMVGKGGQWLRRFPLAGTFVSFPAEIIRTSFNMLRYLKQDMEDPQMADVVPKRVAGLAMVSGGAFALTEFLKNAVDIDDDEDEAIKLLAPPWSKNSNLAYVGREDGNIRYVDLSALDPYSYWKRPINALLRDQPMDDAIVQATVELLTPFFGKDIGAQAVEEVWFNKKETGSQVYNPAEPATDQLADITGHLIKQLSPGLVSNFTRMAKAVNGDVSGTGRRYEVNDELAALAGFRVSTLDPKISLYYKSFEFNENKRNAAKTLTDTFRSVNDVSDAELTDSYRNASRARRRAFEDMIKMVGAARRSGMDEAQVIRVLKNGGVSSKDAKAIARGDVSSYNISDSSLKRYIKRADFLTGESTSSEYQRRFRYLQSLDEEE